MASVFSKKFPEDDLLSKRSKTSSSTTDYACYCHQCFASRKPFCCRLAFSKLLYAAFNAFLLSGLSAQAQTTELQGISCSTSSLIPPGSISCSINLTAPAAPGGFLVQLDSNNPMLAVPLTVLVEAGTSSAAFSATGSDVATNEAATVTAMAGGQQFTATISLTAPTSPVQLIAKNSGKCLDVAGISTTSGALVHQWDCWGGPNQKWQFIPTDDGSFEIESMNSFLALTIGQTPTTSLGAVSIQWPYSGTMNQRWKLKPLSGGFYNLVNEYSSECLDVRGGVTFTANGVLVQQWNCSGQDNQAWDLVLNHSVFLSWNPSPSPDVVGYYVYRATATTGPYTKLTSFPVVSVYADGTVQTGATYYYAVTAINSSNVESVYSNQAKVTVPTP